MDEKQMTICQCCEYLDTMVGDNPEVKECIDYIQERAEAMSRKLMEYKERDCFEAYIGKEVKQLQLTESIEYLETVSKTLISSKGDKKLFFHSKVNDYEIYTLLTIDSGWRWITIIKHPEINDNYWIVVEALVNYRDEENAQKMHDHWVENCSKDIDKLHDVFSNTTFKKGESK